MPTINDLLKATLIDAGFTGTINDMWAAYLRDAGFTGTIPDMEKEWLADAGFTNLKEYLVDKGYTGSINDMMKESLIAGDFIGGGSIAWSATDKSVGITLSENNTVATKISGTRAGAGGDSAYAVSTGKWYVEFYIESAASNFVAVGISPINAIRTLDLGQNSDCYGYHKVGARYFDGNYSQTWTSYTTGDVISLAVDFDGSTLKFFKNNVEQTGVAVTLDSPTAYVPAMSADLNNSSVRIRNSSEYTYVPPDGYSPWEG